MAEKGQAPSDKKKLEKRLSQLERQVRREMDLRIVGLLLDYLKAAQAVLNDEEMLLYRDSLGMVIQNPQAKLSPAVSQIFEKVDGSPVAQEAYDRLHTLVHAKFEAEDIERATTRYLSLMLSRSGYDAVEEPKGSLLRWQSAA